jgi:tetratricopeptide (TPR) repeat protein
VSSIENLKEQARSFEQNEQWEKALDLYNKDIDLLSEQDTPDIALFNRSGDLATKIGSDAQAVAFYERAVDYYMDAGLPNNAIAVCKKVMRNLPDRYSIHLKMGQIRAAQGFITDARTSFVTYAGKVQAAGDIDEAFRALIEFVSLAPDDHEACMVLAAQLEQNGRTDEALSQYIGAYRIMSRQGLGALAEQVAAQIRTIDPDLDLENAASDEVFDRESKSRRAAARSKGGRPHDEADEPEIIGPIDLPLMSFDDEDDDEVPVPTLDAPEAEDSPEATAWEALEEEVEVAPAWAALDDEEDPEETVEDVAALLSLEDNGGEAEEASEDPVALPILGDFVEGGEEAVEEVATGTNLEDFGKAPDEVGAWSLDGGSEEALADALEEALAERAATQAAESAASEAAAEAEAERAAALAAESRAAEASAALAAKQAAAERAAVEAAKLAEAQTAQAAAARAAEEAAAAAAKAAEQAATAPPDKPTPVSNLEAGPSAPTPSSDQYVDLGAMLLGDQTPAEKSTRFVVPYEEPTGDDQADFEKMLAQFREKVSENIDAGDSMAHYDLGTAYMEMGLLNEAISEFQLVLRGAADHLATYEMLGQTFLQKEEPEAALRSLNRGLEVRCDVEEERVGIYYFLGLAHETTGNKDTAVEFYDRVFSLDINFADVTERLRGLRS